MINQINMIKTTNIINKINNILKMIIKIQNLPLKLSIKYNKLNLSYYFILYSSFNLHFLLSLIRVSKKKFIQQNSIKT